MYSKRQKTEISLLKLGWYRVDARGNKEGVNAQFSPPQERLAYNPQLPEEVDFQATLSEPLETIIETLQAQATWDDMLRNLPDISLESAKTYGLVTDNKK